MDRTMEGRGVNEKAKGEGERGGGGGGGGGEEITCRG